MNFQLVPKSVTLNDLERHNGIILRYFSEFGYFPGVLRKSSRSLSHLLMSSCIHLHQLFFLIAFLCPYMEGMHCIALDNKIYLIRSNLVKTKLNVPKFRKFLPRAAMLARYMP